LKNDHQHRWPGLRAEFDRFIKEETDDRILQLRKKPLPALGKTAILSNNLP
jgi:hypothetical protein